MRSSYFQQAGGIDLDPVSVEITYGVERILMALQGVWHFKDIGYAPGISYGEVFGQPGCAVSADTHHEGATPCLIWPLLATTVAGLTP